MSNKVWILTEEYNQYDQYGEYFLAVFKNKPTAEKLKKFGITEQLVQHVLNGGGRQNVEDQWFLLKEEELQ